MTQVHGAKLFLEHFSWAESYLFDQCIGKKREFSE